MLFESNLSRRARDAFIAGGIAELTVLIPGKYIIDSMQRGDPYNIENIFYLGIISTGMACAYSSGRSILDIFKGE